MLRADGDLFKSTFLQSKLVRTSKEEALSFHRKTFADGVYFMSTGMSFQHLAPW